MGRREDAKAERRDRIVVAARELIRETGDAGLSMRALARRAGVSLTTPYNLFGSKRAIVLGAIGDSKAFVEGLERFSNDGVLEKIFGALTVSSRIYAADQRFYMALFQTLFDISGGAEYRHFFGPGRHAFWRALISQAVDEGLIDPDIDLDLFTQALEQSILSTLLQWVLGDISAEHMEPAMAYGFALVLGGAATDKARANIVARRQAREAELKALGITGRYD
jgi:AcrR family transcriptional regulator